MKEFKDLFVELRKEKNYSQIRIAEILDVSKSTIGMWETGKRNPTPEMLEQIADVFNVDMDYIYGKTNIKRKVSFDSYGNQSMTFPDVDERTAELIELFNKSTDAQKESVLNLLRSFV